MTQLPALITASELTTINTLAKTFFDSGLFGDTKNMSQALVKIMAGRELGMGPFESMRDINVIQGKVALTAAAISARIKASGKYDYRIITLENDGCEIEFTQEGKVLSPVSSFNAADAKAAGLNSPMYQKYPRNMYFARALTNGARWHCAEVFGGAVYTPDELRNGAEEAPQAEVHSRPMARDNVRPFNQNTPLLPSVEAEVAQTPAPEEPTLMEIVEPWQHVFEGVEVEGKKIPCAGRRLFEIPQALLEKSLKPINANKLSPADRVAIELALRHPEGREEAALVQLDAEDAQQLASAPVN